MTSHNKSIEELIRELPSAEREAVRNFVESLIAKTEMGARNDGSAHPARFEQLFGSWESGDENSADNMRIDADLAHEYADSHEAGN